MSEQLQLRRGTATQVAAFTGAQGEIVVDTDNKRLVLQDGVTAGGIPVAKLSEAGGGGGGATRTPVSDANYTVLTTDRMIAFTSLSAARTVTLCSASGYPTATILYVVDESGACSASNTITIARAGSDTIDGAASAVIAAPFGFVVLESNGTSQWTIIGQSTGAIGNLGALGIGTAADPSNPLSVAANAVLFNQSATGTSPGNIRVNLSKAAIADTASFIFQDAFSERAEIGLCGDDNFHFKVSPNGSTYLEAININAATGQATVAQSAPFAGFANRFRNGTMDVWQRGTATSIATSGAYFADGWIVVPTGAAVTAQQVSGRGPTLFSLKIAGAAGVSDVVLRQRIESYLAAIFTSQTVTVQAQIYNNSGAAVVPKLSIGHPSAADTYSSGAGSAALTNEVNAASLQSCTNGVWTKVAYTFNASSNAGNGLEVNFDFGALVASESVQVTELDIRVTPNIATGLNSNPPAPELRPIWSELDFCQSYFQIIKLPTMQVTAAGNALSYVNLLTTMRATPTQAILTAPTFSNASSFALNGATSQFIFFTWVATASGGFLYDAVVSAIAEL